MWRFVLSRIAMTVPTVIGITVLAFALARLLPGDPVEVMLGERMSDKAVHAKMVQQLGLDQPLPHHD